MAKLDIVYTLGLAFPLWSMGGVFSSPIVIEFPETSNIVRIDPPDGTEFSDLRWGQLSKLVLRVERECTESEASDVMAGNHQRHKISQDAARALFLCFETLREIEYLDHNVLHGYPVVLTEAIQSNPLVRKCDVETAWNGRRGQPMSQGSRPTIMIRDDTWNEVVDRLKKRHSVPVYTSFILDACYFAQHDPLRGIIMACAAWETAMRQYLGNVASKIDPAYEIASKGGNIPRLLQFVRAAKGGDLFHNVIEESSNPEKPGRLETYRDLVFKLPELRNKLLHQGNTGIQARTALDSAHAVLLAIRWLFAG